MKTRKKATLEQKKVILGIIKNLLNELNLSEIQAQEIIKAGGTFQEQVKPILQKLAILDQRFGPAVKDFEFMVPADYQHDTQLDTFAEKTKRLKTTYYFNDGLTSKNFAKATNKLLPSKTYRMRIFPVLETVTNEDCMTFLKKQGAILVGAQGLTLLQENKADEFPVVKWTVSFDEKDALWEDADGHHRVPSVYRFSDGGWKFNLDYFDYDWGDYHCLLCVTEV